ncbi:MAG: RNA polymerase sigma factor [Phycisphaerae bacterium]|nr:RNA polymerase sigma factor [Phycisphaerae bacterium]
MPPTSAPQPGSDRRPESPLGPDDIEDLRLVRAIRAGTCTQAAWAQLLGRYQDRLFGICLRMVHNRETAADLAQDALVKVMQGLDTFDDRARLSTWVTRVTINLCLSHLRAQKLRKTVSLDAIDIGRDSSVPDPTLFGNPPKHGVFHNRELSESSGVQDDEARTTLLVALAALDPEQRAILVLRDVRGLEYEQIAEVLGVAIGTVKSRLFRARVAMRALIESMESPDRTPLRQRGSQS